ncbi:MAG: hypothetical protein ABIH89_10900 [Elusimicrobiota bacterium]
MDNKPEFKVRRAGGYSHNVVPIIDKTGKVISHAVKPLMVELRIRE